MEPSTDSDSTANRNSSNADGNNGSLPRHLQPDFDPHRNVNDIIYLFDNEIYLSDLSTTSCSSSPRSSTNDSTETSSHEASKDPNRNNASNDGSLKSSTESEVDDKFNVRYEKATKKLSSLDSNADSSESEIPCFLQQDSNSYRDPNGLIHSLSGGGSSKSASTPQKDFAAGYSNPKVLAQSKLGAATGDGRVTSFCRCDTDQNYLRHAETVIQENLEEEPALDRIIHSDSNFQKECTAPMSETSKGVIKRRTEAEISESCVSGSSAMLICERNKRTEDVTMKETGNTDTLDPEETLRRFFQGETIAKSQFEINTSASQREVDNSGFSQLITSGRVFGALFSFSNDYQNSATIPNYLKDYSTSNVSHSSVGNNNNLDSNEKQEVFSGRRKKKQSDRKQANPKKRIFTSTAQKANTNGRKTNQGKTRVSKAPKRLEYKMKKRIPSGARALREIKHYQNTTNLCIRILPFQRLVSEITSRMFGQDTFKFQTDAILTLQEAAEKHLVNLFEHANLYAAHAGRVTVMVKDIKLVKRIGGR